MQVQISLLFDNDALTSKAATIIKELTCCVEATHAVNAVLEHPGKQTPVTSFLAFTRFYLTTKV